MQLRRVDEFSSAGSRRTHRGRRKRPANYQRMKAKGKLSEAGKKLENLKCALDKLSAHQWQHSALPYPSRWEVARLAWSRRAHAIDRPRTKLAAAN